MSNVPAATITRDDINRAATTAVLAVAGVMGNAQFIYGISKAAEELESGNWAWFADAQILKIASRTRPGKWYTIGAGGCSPQCEAAQNGRICWHRCARRIMIRATEAAKDMAEMQSTWARYDASFPLSPAQLAQHQSEADALFS